jgi:hypothetical protein
VHAGTLIGRCEEKTGIAAFERPVADLMAREPYSSARTVYLVCDNGSSHRWNASIERTAEKWPNGCSCTCRCMRAGSTRSRSPGVTAAA